MKKVLLVLLVSVLFIGCADVTPIQECLTGDPYGFWSGIWHGWTAPFSFVGSIFSDNIAIYAVDNTGGWYDFGFVVGIGSLGSGITYKSK